MRIESHRPTFPELDLVRGFTTQIRGAEAEIVRERELPPALAADLKQAGLFRLLLPRAMGGSELALPKYIRCIEAIAEADGSAGWCVGQGGVFANSADGMAVDLADEIWGANPAAVVATGTPAGCEAVERDGALHLTGHWRFASGCRHADWLAAMADLRRADGSSYFGMCIVPSNDVDLLDGWNVTGLRGTGSREYRADSLRVPLHRGIPIDIFRSHRGAATGLSSGLLFATSFGSVGLGIARRALDTLVDLAQDKVPAFGDRKLLQDSLVQTGLAQAEAQWGSARSFLLDVAESCHYQLEQGEGPDGKSRTHLRLAATNAMRTAGVVVDKVYELAGSSGVFDDHPLHKCFQDIHALTQQIQARPAHFRSVGRALLGVESLDSVG